MNRFQTQSGDTWAVEVERETPVERRRLTSLKPEEPPRRPPLWPLAVAALLLAAAAATGFAVYRSHQARLAERERARQTVTDCLVRMETLLRQAPAHQNRLTARASEVGVVIAATEPNAGFK